MCAHCHVITVDIEIKSLEALEKACKRLGWTFHKNCSKYKWFGKWVDDSPIPEHLFHPEDAKRIKAMTRESRKDVMTHILNNNASHKISIPGLEYEIGVFKVEGQYQLAIDWWGDISNLRAHNPLPQAYAAEVAIAKANSLNQPWVENTLEDGTIVLKIETESW